MNIEKFTDRAREIVQGAQAAALRSGHQRLMPEHLLAAMLDDDQGLAGNLITAAGGDVKAAKIGVDGALAAMPQVSGGGDQMYLDPSLARLMDEANRLAEKSGDAFVTAERLLLALAMA